MGFYIYIIRGLYNFWIFLPSYPLLFVLLYLFYASYSSWGLLSSQFPHCLSSYSIVANSTSYKNHPTCLSPKSLLSILNLWVLYSFSQVMYKKTVHITYYVFSWRSELKTTFIHLFNRWKVIYTQFRILKVGLGDLGVTFSPRDPRFEGSNPAEADKFFTGRKNPEHMSSGRDFNLEVPSLRFQAR